MHFFFALKKKVMFYVGALATAPSWNLLTYQCAPESHPYVSFKKLLICCLLNTKRIWFWRKHYDHNDVTIFFNKNPLVFVPHKGQHRAGNTVFESKCSLVVCINPALAPKSLLKAQDWKVWKCKFLFKLIGKLVDLLSYLKNHCLSAATAKGFHYLYVLL